MVAAFRESRQWTRSRKPSGASKAASPPTSADEIAAVIGVSRFHLSRAFGVATSHSISALCPRSPAVGGGTPARKPARPTSSRSRSIGATALTRHSHRASREQFPASRRNNSRAGRDLVTAARWSPYPCLAKPASPCPNRAFVTGADLVRRLRRPLSPDENTQGIPRSGKGSPRISGISLGQVGYIAYGVSYTATITAISTYIAGAEVSEFTRTLPTEFEAHLRARAELRAGRPSIAASVTGIKQTHEAIFRDWLPEIGAQAGRRADAGAHGRGVSTRATGNGVVEISLALKTDGWSASAKRRCTPSLSSPMFFTRPDCRSKNVSTCSPLPRRELRIEIAGLDQSGETSLAPFSTEIVSSTISRRGR